MDETLAETTTKQLNDPKHVEPIIHFTINQLINSTFESIKQKQLLNHFAEFQHYNQMILLNEFIFQSTPNFGMQKPHKILQQDCKAIIKIQKDNLSPKQLPSQYNQNQGVKKLPQSISQFGSKRLGLTNRSSFLKRKSSIISQVSSSMGPQKRIMNRMQNSKNQQSIRMSKSNSLKKDPLQNFTSIMIPEQQDQYILHLRQKVQFKSKEKEKQLKIITARLNQDKQKRQSFLSKFGQANQYTFDFEGQTLQADLSKQQKLNYYAMRFGMKTLSRKFRQMYKNIEQGKNNEKSQSITSRNKNSTSKQIKNNTIDLKASLQIPMFDQQHRSFLVQTDPSKLKIKQYKRLYGRKFSRYDNNSLTIDMSCLKQNKTLQQDYFSSKKHFKDSSSLNKSRKSSISKQYIQKKLALPKLQGKYKVLDRYQQI